MIDDIICRNSRQRGTWNVQKPFLQNLMQETLGMPCNARVTILRNATSQWWLSLWTSSTAMGSSIQGEQGMAWQLGFLIPSRCGVTKFGCHPVTCKYGGGANHLWYILINFWNICKHHHLAVVSLHFRVVGAQKELLGRDVGKHLSTASLTYKNPMNPLRLCAMMFSQKLSQTWYGCFQK